MRFPTTLAVGLALVVGPVGCVSARPDVAWSTLPNLRQAVGPLDAQNPTTLERVSRDRERLAAACTRASQRLNRHIAAAHDDEARAKTIVGIITGGVTGVLGTISGVIGATDTAPATWESPSIITGLITAALGVAGAIIIAAFTPAAGDMAESQRQISEVAAAQQALDDYVAANTGTHAIADWTNEYAGWAQRVGAAEGACNAASPEPEPAH